MRSSTLVHEESLGNVLWKRHFPDVRMMIFDEDISSARTMNHTAKSPEKQPQHRRIRRLYSTFTCFFNIIMAFSHWNYYE